MAGWPRIYQYLAGCKDQAVDEVLVAGARQLDGSYLRYAVEVLLQRAGPKGLLAVVENYHRFSPDLRGHVLGAIDVLAPALRTAIRDLELQTRLNCLEIASRLNSESLGYLFDLGLLDMQVKVREQAASLVRQMTSRLLADHPLLCTPDGIRQAAADEVAAARLGQRREHLFEALLSGVQRYESHLRGEVVEACLWFEPYLGERFWDLSRQPRSRLPRLLADLLVRSDEPATACFLPQAIAVPPLRVSAVKTISERRDPKWFRAVIRGAELWHTWPRVRKAWGFIKGIACLETIDEKEWSTLGRSHGLPILLASTNLPAQPVGEAMARLMAVGSTTCRQQVLLEATRCHDWGIPLLRSVLAESRDPRELRMAACSLLQLDYDGLAGDLARRLGSPADPAAAGLVDLAAEQLFWQLWTRFDAMDEPLRVAAAASIKTFASHLRTRLRVSLAAASSSVRLRAVRMVGLLGLLDELWPDVRIVARDRNSRVRSAAVRILGASNRRELKEQLRSALDDPDSRVQANAVEAVEQAAWPDCRELLAPRLQSPHNRVRAMAARALVRLGDDQAATVLRDMLHDPVAEHRTTAVWTIKSIGPGPWIDPLYELAEHDPSSAVRRLAQSVLRDAPKIAVAARD